MEHISDINVQTSYFNPISHHQDARQSFAIVISKHVKTDVVSDTLGVVGTVYHIAIAHALYTCITQYPNIFGRISFVTQDPMMLVIDVD